MVKKPKKIPNKKAAPQIDLGGLFKKDNELAAERQEDRHKLDMKLLDLALEQRAKKRR